MSYESVKKYFHSYGMEDRIIVLGDSIATVELAAEVLHTKPSSIAKTLSFMVNERPVLIVMEGTARVDNHLFKEFFGVKAKMMKYGELVELVGHEPGGVCPFGIKEGVEVYLDDSLKRHESIYPACGSSNTAIQLSLEELEKYSSYKEWIHVCKEPVND